MAEGSNQDTQRITLDDLYMTFGRPDVSDCYPSVETGTSAGTGHGEWSDKRGARKSRDPIAAVVDLLSDEEETLSPLLERTNTGSSGASAPVSRRSIPRPSVAAKAKGSSRLVESSVDPTVGDLDDDPDEAFAPPRPSLSRNASAPVPIRSAAPLASFSDSRESATPEPSSAPVRAKRPRPRASKTTKQRERHFMRQKQGAFKEQELTVWLGPSLASSPVGRAISASLDDAGYKYAVSAADKTVEGFQWTVRWARQVLSPAQVLTGPAEDEPLMVRVWAADAFPRHLLECGTDGCLAHAQRLRSDSANSRLMYVLQGVTDSLTHRQRRAVQSPESLLRPTQVDDISAELLLQEDVDVWPTDNVLQTAELITRLTRSVCERPFRGRPSALACVPKLRVQWLDTATRGMDGGGESGEDAGSVGSASGGEESGSQSSSARGGGAGKRGGKAPGRGRGGFRGPATMTAEEKQRAKQRREDPNLIFFAQLQMIPGISATKARNIVRHYPTQDAMVKALTDYTIPEAERRLLLSNVMHPRQRQPVLSERVFTFYTTLEGSIVP